MQRLFFLFMFLNIAACNEQEIVEPIKTVPKGTPKIIHISHTKHEDIKGKISQEVIDIPLENYEIICHGGDVDKQTTLEENYLAAWDTIFHFNQPNTLWTVGNHDVNNRALIEQYTNRSSYYRHSINNITFLVLDSQLDFSNISGAQLEWFNTEITSLQTTKYLLILTHKLIWMPNQYHLEPLINIIPNGEPGDCGFCTNPNNFYEDIYPKLRDIQANGIDVFCIAGDVGNNVKSFRYLTEDGIQFLASGMATDALDNKALVFYWDDETKTLDWQFEFIRDL